MAQRHGHHDMHHGHHGHHGMHHGHHGIHHMGARIGGGMHHGYGGGGGYGMYRGAWQQGGVVAQRACACQGGVAMIAFGGFFVIAGFIMTVTSNTGISVSSSFFYEHSSGLRTAGPVLLGLGIFLIVVGIILVCVMKRKLVSAMSNVTNQYNANIATTTYSASMPGSNDVPMATAGPATIGGTTPFNSQYPTGTAAPRPADMAPYSAEETASAPAYAEPLTEKPDSPPSYDDAKKM